ncbi:MAG: hypothetical protein HY986_02540 [Candidatus Melainabacteria bacterium]|nr:hypothetical protein [Candidatus Melainabacteria bacterium]
MTIHGDNALYLRRYQIRVGAEIRGGYSGITYDEATLCAACAQCSLTTQEFENIVDNAEDWDLPFPDLPEGEYLFFFTPEGDRLFRSCLGHIEAFACALALGGVLEVLQVPYTPDGLVYEDTLQVAFLAGSNLNASLLPIDSITQLGPLA